MIEWSTYAWIVQPPLSEVELRLQVRRARVRRRRDQCQGEQHELMMEERESTPIGRGRRARAVRTCFQIIVLYRPLASLGPP